MDFLAAMDIPAVSWDFPTIIGSVGVGLLLLAYFLNVFGLLAQESLSCMLLNIMGSALSCYASFLIHYMPFVVLEALWFIVAVISLIRFIIAKFEASTAG